MTYLIHTSLRNREIWSYESDWCEKDWEQGIFFYKATIVKNNIIEILSVYF